MARRFGLTTCAKSSKRSAVSGCTSKAMRPASWAAVEASTARPSSAAALFTLASARLTQQAAEPRTLALQAAEPLALLGARAPPRAPLRAPLRLPRLAAAAWRTAAARGFAARVG